MPRVLRVTWSVTPATTPLVWRKCPACQAATPFQSTGAFRTNAQKKRIDIWLIYRCTACDARWNLPVFERVMISDLAPDLFAAIAHNDPVAAHRYASDLARLARHSHRIEASRALTVAKSGERAWDGDTIAIDLTIAVSVPTAIRLDQVLAQQLALSRSRLSALYEDGAISLAPARRKGLRARLAGAQRVGIDVSGLDAAAQATMLAAACA